LDELLLHIGSLASIYHKNPTTFISHYKPRYLIPSAAFKQRTDTNDTAALEQMQKQQQLQQQQQQQQQQQLQKQQQQQQMNALGSSPFNQPQQEIDLLQDPQQLVNTPFNDWSYNAATANNRVVSQINNPYSTDLLQ
jgi:hypothetical protein